MNSGLDSLGGPCPRPLQLSWLISGTKECLPCNPTPQSHTAFRKTKTPTPNPISPLHRKPEPGSLGRGGPVLMPVSPLLSAEWVCPARGVVSLSPLLLNSGASMGGKSLTGNSQTAPFLAQISRNKVTYNVLRFVPSGYPLCPPPFLVPITLECSPLKQ